MELALQRKLLEQLRCAGVERPERDLARLRQWCEDGNDLEQAVNRRAAREPLAYVTGQKAFWKGDFASAPTAMVPRPESETLVAAAVDRASHGSIRVLDLGVGTGCLLISVLVELPRARGVGVDRSQAALRVARTNARRHGVKERCQLRRGDWRCLHGWRRHRERYDMVLCNPPYVARSMFALLEPEVARAEPRVALDGGIDGLQAYRQLAPLLPYLLKKRGIACLECGAGQLRDVARITAAAGCEAQDVVRDLDRHERCLVLARA